MSDALERHRKECEEMQLAGMIWWLILWYASDEGRNEIPSEQQWLSCELVAAIIEEVTGEQFWYSWRHDESGQEVHHQWNEWPVCLNAVLDEKFVRVFHGMVDGITPVSRMRRLLKGFVCYEFHSDHDEKGFTSELKWFHENHTPRPGGRSRFTPTREMVAESIGFLGGQGIEIYAGAMTWCEKIGTIMRPYVVRDVAYIKTHYNW